MPRKRAKHERVKNPRNRPSFGLKIRISPLHPYDRATDMDVTDVDYLREHLNNKIVQAVSNVLAGDETVGFDQSHFNIDVWTSN